MNFAKGTRFWYRRDSGEGIELFYIGEKNNHLLFEDIKHRKWYCPINEYKKRLFLYSNYKYDKKRFERSDKTKEAWLNSSRPMYVNGNLDEDLGVYTTKYHAPRSDKKPKDKKILPNYSGSKYAGGHRSGIGVINKKTKKK